MIAVKRYIAFFCLVTIAVFIVPKEFIHSLYGHTDTIDVFQKDNVIQFEKQHRHCEILKYETPLYHNIIAFIALSLTLHTSICITRLYNPYLSRLYSHSRSRAPPINSNSGFGYI
jgi:hypothetical protein